MRRLAPLLAVAVLLGGCTYAWIRPDATPAQAQADERVCRAEAADVVNEVLFDARPWPGVWGPPAVRWGPGWYTGWWPDPSAQYAAQQRVYDRCMNAKGYQLVRIDRKTGEPR